MFKSFAVATAPTTPTTPTNSADVGFRAEIEAIERSQAVIRFAMDGTILNANRNFLNVLGYTLDEVKGRHHRIFVEPAYADSADYREFWAKLNRGEFDTQIYKRIGKNGREVWIQASYNPVMDANGRPCEVVKFSTDVTAQQLAHADSKGQIDAVNKVQAVIHFNMDGKILEANDNFLDLMGYSLGEVRGKHHSIFVEPGHESTEEYRRFWENLREGKFDSRIYKRIGKGGKQVWIQASYNPIFDMNGRPFKVVKFATDQTEMINMTESTGTSAESVATASSELTASIEEITKNIALSKKATDNILSTAGEGEKAAASLVDSMKSMEKIVNLIRDISSRVNILALNATIEAARAGEAGKGFAVVATEVKSLSNQTAEATDQIAKEIGAVQTISGSVATGIQGTVTGIREVSKYINSVAVAMEEQTAVTREISENTTRTSQAVRQIIDKAKRGNQ